MKIYLVIGVACATIWIKNAFAVEQQLEPLDPALKLTHLTTDY